MRELEKKVLAAIDQYGMIREGDTVWAAVSGGFDSMAMLSALLALRPLRKFSVRVLHLNHLLRENAGEDEAYVRRFCLEQGIPFHAKRVLVGELAKEKKISLETAGREVRYAFFAQAAGEKGIVATAHNANDHAESVMMHLMRGCGLRGLCGIPPKRGNLIRPLIFCTRAEIEAYCEELGLHPRTDETNADDAYTRNDLRLHVMPQLYERCGVEAFGRLSDAVLADEELLEELTAQAVKRVKDHAIPRKEFCALPKALQGRLLQHFYPHASFVQIRSAMAMCERGMGGKKAEMTGGTVILKNGSVWFYGT